MTCLHGKLVTKQRANLSTQLDTIQEDLVRLPRFVIQVSGLTDEDLAAFEISDPLQSIHHYSNRFGARCLASQIATNEDVFAAPVDEGSFEINFPAQQLDNCLNGTPIWNDPLIPLLIR